MTARVLLADDHTILRDGLRALIEKHPDLEVVGEASDGEEAVALAVSERPDVVIMDVAMPRLNGIEACRKIGAVAPHVLVIALSTYGDRRFVRGMRDAGACGYLLKDCASDQLVDAIHAVLTGSTCFPPDAAPGHCPSLPQ